mmetsp:Transcript_9026/g.15375  ORF Transcript_9026/g.15375 Transcript_9026/m.15375 type:complete len:113 (-) Transcript_9026:829-1167(-)
MTARELGSGPIAFRHRLRFARKYQQPTKQNAVAIDDMTPTSRGTTMSESDAAPSPPPGVEGAPNDDCDGGGGLGDGGELGGGGGNSGGGAGGGASGGGIGGATIVGATTICT